MHRRRPVKLTAAVALLAWIFSCAAPKEVDYLAPDAAPAPEAPVPVSVTPENGAEDVFRKPVVRVIFDRQIDARTLSSGKLDFDSGPLGKWTLSYYNPIKRELVVWTSSTLLRQTTWTFRIDDGLLGLNGFPVHPQILTTFRTGDSKGSDEPFTPRSYESEVLPVLKQHCVSCHGGDNAIAGLKLDTIENIEETALETPATAWQNWHRIVPGRPGESFLLLKLSDYEDLPGLEMPRAKSDAPPSTLTDEEKTALVEWIAGGASFFDPTPEDE